MYRVKRKFRLCDIFFFFNRFKKREVLLTQPRVEQTFQRRAKYFSRLCPRRGRVADCWPFLPRRNRCHEKRGGQARFRAFAARVCASRRCLTPPLNSLMAQYS